MNLDLKGKTALVAGSTQGLGKAAAEEIALLGANVVLIARNEASLQAVKATLDQSKGQAHDYLVADFSQPEQVQKLVQQYLTEKPIEAIHILVNNTGGPAGGNILEAEVQAFRDAYEMHLVCNHLLVQTLSPYMKKAGYGRIINIISTSVREPIPGLGVSNTTRWAVAAWAKTLSRELGAYGITINNLLPGFTKTARLDSIIKTRAEKAGTSEAEVIEGMYATIPAGRFGKAEEVGATIAFLASPAAAYINGTNIVVDGGRLASM